MQSSTTLKLIAMRKQAIRELINGNKSQAEISRIYKVRRQSVSMWMKSNATPDEIEVWRSNQYARSKVRAPRVRGL